jgi:hypothetical protein
VLLLLLLLLLARKFTAWQRDTVASSDQDHNCKSQTCCCAVCRKVYALAEKHGGIFKIKAPGRTVVVITDPTALAEATAMEFTGVDKPADIYNTFAVVSEENLQSDCMYA